MTSVRRAAAVLLPAFLACALSGCGGGSPRFVGVRATATGSTASNAASAPDSTPASDPASAPASVPGVVGYLHADTGEVDYLQWQADTTGALQGTELDATVKGSVPNAQVSVNNSGLYGQFNGSSLTLTVPGGSARAVLTGDTLTVNTVASDGSIQPVAYRRASDAEYNTALSALRTTVDQANVQQNLADSQSAAVQKVAGDYQSISSLKPSLHDGLATLGTDVTGADTDLAQTHTDEQTVLSEAGNGTDNSSVCGDASGVSGDASGVSGDASGVSADVQSITGDLTSLRDATTAITADLQALLTIEPGYAGDGSGPSPADVQRAVSGAASAAGTAVKAANEYVARANSAVTAAYGYAATASKAGNCGLDSTAPDPIGRISSPFAGNGGASA